MKHKAKQQKLRDRIADFKSDRTVQKTITEHPGSYHQPGSLKK